MASKSSCAALSGRASGPWVRSIDANHTGATIDVNGVETDRPPIAMSVSAAWRWRQMK